MRGDSEPTERRAILRGGSSGTTLSPPSTGLASVTQGPLPQPSFSVLGAGNSTAGRVGQPPSSWSLIPQLQYIPPKSQGEFTPEDPIQFCVDGVPGISVSQATDLAFTRLDGGGEKMGAFKRASVTCRVQVVGHRPYASKVNAHDQTSEWKPILRSKLAKEVGKKVKAYIEGEKLQGSIPIDKVYLTRLIHVSKGSWQPELYLDDLGVSSNLTV